LESELLLEEKELSELRKILSLDEFRPKALEFDERVSIIRTEQGEKEENLKNNSRKEEAEFYKRVYPLLYELLLKRGGLVLIDQRSVILWDNSVDITDAAIELINKELRNGIISN
jgi:Skp family chaperone for outer membrane proteins